MSEERSQHPQDPAEGAEVAPGACGPETKKGCRRKGERGPSSTHRSPPRAPRKPWVPSGPKTDASPSCSLPRSDKVGKQAGAPYVRRVLATRRRLR